VTLLSSNTVFPAFPIYTLSYLSFPLSALGHNTDLDFSGDWMRSALPALESVIDAGIRVLIYNGDVVRPLLFLPLLVECGWCLPGDVGLHRELPGC
jgi:hypothetical protein